MIHEKENMVEKIDGSKRAVLKEKTDTHGIKKIGKTKKNLDRMSTKLINDKEEIGAKVEDTKEIDLRRTETRGKER